MIAAILGADDVDPTLATRYPLESIASAYLVERDHPRLRDLLRQEFAQQDAEPHDGHKALEYLASHGYIDRVYTTNFDDLIEQSLGARAVSITDEDPDALLRALETDEIPVIHLHGSVGYRCLIAEEETYSLDTPLARVMASDMVTCHFVWIGYSMSDVDLRGLYLSIRELLKRDDLVKTSYFVHPAGSAEECRLAELVWQARGGRYIAAGADEFLPALVRAARRARGDEVVSELLGSEGKDPKNPVHREDLWSRAQDIAEDHRFDDELEGLAFLAQRAGVESNL